MASFVDACKFSPVAGGTADFTYSSAVTGYQSPSSANVVNGSLYRYRAESSDLSQWEDGYGFWSTSGAGSISRFVVTSNSLGNTSKINFSTVPAVSLVATAADMGGWTNRRIAKSATYTIAPADGNATIALSGASFYALIFSAPSGYDPNHVNMVVNEDTGRAKMLLPFYTASSTSLAIATGSKAFTVASGLSFSAQKRFRAYSLANPANFMAGLVSYTGTTLTMTVDTIGGTGTFTDWQISPEILLWPAQSTTMFVQNGVWYWTERRYASGAITLNVDPTGNDSNDGLGTGTGALKTLSRASALAYSSIDVLGFGSVTIDGGGNTFQEFVGVYCPLPNGGPGSVIVFQNFTWKPANSNYALQFGDGALVTITNITFTTAGVTSPVGFVNGHNHGVLDSNTGNSIAAPVALSGDAFSCDFDTHFNINNGMTINAGTYGFMYNGGQGSNWNIAGQHTFVGTPSIGRWAWARMSTKMVFQGNFSVSGANTTSVSLVNQNGSILNVSGVTLPGGTPTPTTGGQYNTSISA
jgi:hypothetical protein